MKFHLIHNTDISSNFEGNTAFELLKSACLKQSVDFVSHDIQNFDLFELPTLGPNDLLYRAAGTSRAVAAQRQLMNAQCTSFYTDWRSVFKGGSSSYFLNNAHNLPVIPSFSGIPSTENELNKCVEQLGPFPMIVKVMGKSLGIGVIRVDSIESLRSVLDYLKSLKVNVLVRKYINHEYYVRAVVVGDKVVASYAAYAMDGEFRTNAGDDTYQKREVKVLSIEQQEMVVKSVRVLGVETSGVDLLFDRNDKPYIAEVNFPNNFTIAQGATGIDIASEMVSHLVDKAQSRV